jgi:UDPglucose 6-dehydrogenase
MEAPASARSVGAPAFVAEATETSNRDGITRLAKLTVDHLPEGGTVAVLGLSYKPNTDVVDESPGMHLVRTLSDAGINVVAYDPVAVGQARRVLDGGDIQFAESAEDAIRAGDVVVIATPWQEFAALDPLLFDRGREQRVVIDCWRILTRERVAAVATYIALGEAPAEARAASSV